MAIERLIDDFSEFSALEGETLRRPVDSDRQHCARTIVATARILRLFANRPNCTAPDTHICLREKTSGLFSFSNYT